jgi:hypothetical protein
MPKAIHRMRIQTRRRRKSMPQVGIVALAGAASPDAGAARFVPRTEAARQLQVRISGCNLDGGV